MKTKTPFLRAMYCIALLISSIYAHQTRALELATIAVHENHDQHIENTSAYSLSWKILSYAARRNNIHLVAHNASWPGAVRRLKAGKVDLVFMAIKTPEREKWAQFSLPLIGTGSAIFTYLDNPVADVEQIDLLNSTIGVSADSVHEKFAEELGFTNIYSSADRLQLFKMLNKRRLNYLFFSPGGIDTLCSIHGNTSEPDCLKQVGDIHHKGTTHVIGLNNKSSTRRLLRKINSSLMRIADSHYVESLFTEHSVPKSTYAQWLSSIDASKN